VKKLYEIKHRITGDVIFALETTSMKMAVRAAVKKEISLRNSDLRYSDLRYSDLSNSDLRYSDLSNSDLRYSDLRNSNLRNSDLRNSDLRYSDLDFSSGFSFRCSSFGIKADLRLSAQLAYHFCRFDFGDCAEAKDAQKALQELANEFHRVEECGKIDIK